MNSFKYIDDEYLSGKRICIKCRTEMTTFEKNKYGDYCEDCYLRKLEEMEAEEDV